ncbi:Aldehyde dehydrogenase domain protein, partial [Metarhizium majus ARSEF 297]
MDTIATLWNADTPDAAEALLKTTAAKPLRLQNFVGNEFYKASSSVDALESFNPRTGKVLVHVPSSSPADVDQAVDAAANAFPSWSRTPRQERARLLQKVAHLIQENKNLFAVWESMDQGKTLARAEAEVDRAATNFSYFAQFILREEGTVRYVDGESPIMAYEHRSPAGVFGLITPWNMPLYLLTWKIAPCLAFGCVAVAKPSEVTSVTAFLLCEIFRQAKLPPGVINMVFGKGATAGSALVTSPKVRGVSFTGGVSTGIRIRQDTAADVGKHISLELGGKNPNLIFEDVEMGKAVPLAAKAAFENGGQICLCASRIYIHRSRYEEFLPAFVGYVKQNYICGGTLGPVVSREHYSKIRSYLALARKESATFHLGSVPEEDPQGGYWIPPVVLTGLSQESRVVQEEIFGPVVTVSTFETEDEAIALANDNANGLAAVVMTNDVSRMRRVGERIDAGLVWANCWLVRELGTSFGGLKASGVGREGGVHSREVFTNLRTVHVPSSW